MVQHWNDLVNIFSEHPLNAFFLILAILLLEVILSFDNAAVLATMVKDLEPDKQAKALRYGIIGAYVFRGAALLLVDKILEIWWLKPIGGAYLLWMCFQHFYGKVKDEAEAEVTETKKGFFYRYTVGFLGVFWSTVLLVEFMDIVFSIDNIFAVVSYSDNIFLICIGVFIGILAMRYVAKYFVVLMEKYPFLEKSAFIVIGILGVKLCFSVLVHFGEPDFHQGKVTLFDVTNKQVVQQISLEDKHSTEIKSATLQIKLAKNLTPTTRYEIMISSESKDLSLVKNAFWGEDKRWLFKTSSSDLGSTKGKTGSIYPQDNSVSVPLKPVILIKGQNKYGWIDSEQFDLFISIITLLIFFLPILSVKITQKK